MISRNADAVDHPPGHSPGLACVRRPAAGWPAEAGSAPAGTTQVAAPGFPPGAVAHPGAGMPAGYAAPQAMPA